MHKLIDHLLGAMREAGSAIEQLQATGFSIETKANNDIVTKADLLADEILKDRLLKPFPDYGWLSEESVDNAERLNRQYIWIVDPIDGTKEYATHVPEYAISVALVEYGKPVLASVFNPATGELFHAVRGEGAWLNGVKLDCRSMSAEDVLLLASRSEYKRGEWQVYENVYEVKQVGSIAYKLALIAAGKAHGTFSLGPKNEWDIAAGVLIAEEAGAIVSDKHKKPFLFNQKNVLVDGVVALVPNVNQAVFALIDQFDHPNRIAKEA